MTEKPGRRSRPVALQAVLGNIFAGTPLGQRLKEARVWTIWEGTVGATVANRAHPVQFRDGILTVAVTSAPWLQQLTFMKKDLVAALNRECGEELVRDIYLTAASGPRKPHAPKTAPSRRNPPIPPDQIAKIAAETGDPELARLLTRLMELDGAP
jgi:predicted nucleic acid-binding Zn ribbon protein